MNDLEFACVPDGEQITEATFENLCDNKDEGDGEDDR